MKYLYKKNKKKLLMLFFLLPAALPAAAQVPGAPYGLTALSTAGSFLGRTCFDVARVNDDSESGSLTSRRSETLAADGTRADFSNSLTRIQTYTFTPSGTVSNVRFYFVEASPYEGLIIEDITGGNPGNQITSATPVTCTVVYKSDLNDRASGRKNANALSVGIYAVYNDHGYGLCTDKSVKLTVRISDCACCGAFTADGSWLAFMCYNVGADTTLITPDQTLAAAEVRTHGYLYQWGKRKPWPATGTGTISGWSSEGNEDLDGSGYNNNKDAWGRQGAKTVADPCPDPWRVPSQHLWQELIDGTRPQAGNYSVGNDQRPILTPIHKGTMYGRYLYLPRTTRIQPDGTWEVHTSAYWNNHEYPGNMFLNHPDASYVAHGSWAAAVPVRCALY